MLARADFRLFGPAHLSIIAGVPACAAALAWLSRRRPDRASWIRLSLGVLLAINALCWYAYRFAVLGIHLPQGLPFELCDISLWLTVYSLLRLNQISFELAYYWGLAGAAMAVLTPDLMAPLLSPSSIIFFLGHGGLIVSILYLLWSHHLRPRPKSWRLAFLALNIYAAGAGIFDFVSGVNYLYLRNKPASASLLNAMGPWPLYIFAADLLALVMFLIMAIPFAKDAIVSL
jgi:hypothetical integral membrane protein (TIGR02206 family)